MIAVYLYNLVIEGHLNYSAKIQQIIKILCQRTNKNYFTSFFRINNHCLADIFCNLILLLYLCEHNQQ